MKMDQEAEIMLDLGWGRFHRPSFGNIQSACTSSKLYSGLKIAAEQGIHFLTISLLEYYRFDPF